MFHALKNTAGEVIRYQDWQETPPVLSESKGLQWVQEEPPSPPKPDPDTVEQFRVARLWQAAHDYEYAEISGSAVGLLAMGVMQGKPKCIAAQNWIQSIWTLYYTRKAGTSTDTDYSECGACPYSVPELIAEVMNG